MAPEINERWEELIAPEHVKYVLMANGVTPRCAFCIHSGAWRGYQQCNSCKSGSGKKLVKANFSVIDARSMKWRVDEAVRNAEYKRQRACAVRYRYD